MGPCQVLRDIKSGLASIQEETLEQSLEREIDTYLLGTLEDPTDNFILD